MNLTINLNKQLYYKILAYKIYKMIQYQTIDFNDFINKNN